MIILFHAGVDIGLPPPYHCTPERLFTLIKDFPGGVFVASHMGGYKCWDQVEELLAGRSIYFDTSYSLHALGAEKVVKIIKAHGMEKVLFGTDSPWASQEKEIERFNALVLSSDDKKNILGMNAAMLLGIL